MRNYGVAFWFRVALAAVFFQAGGAAWAVSYYVDGSAGTDRAGCGTGSAASACQTIMYVVNNRALTGGDTVNIAAGTYREQVEVTAADDGTSDTSRVVFRGAGRGVTFISGLRTTSINDGTHWTLCTAAANCAGDGAAYSNVYRGSASGFGSVRGVYELAWQNILVDDNPGDSGAEFYFTKPVTYTSQTSVQNVNSLSGSYFVSGGSIFVHTFHDEVPSEVGTNIEVSDRFYGVRLDGANFVTIQDMTIQYVHYGMFVGGDYDRIENVEIHSNSGQGFGVGPTSDHIVGRNLDVSHTYLRGEYSLPCNASCGWTTNASTSCFGVSGEGQGGANGFHDFSRVDVYNCWNGVAIEATTNSTFADFFVRNVPNHPFIMKGVNGECHHNKVIRSVAINGQDDFYIAGCTDQTYIRLLGAVGAHWNFGTVAEDSVRQTVRGCISTGAAAPYDFPLGMATDNLVGHRIDYDLLDAANNRCIWGMGNSLNCGQAWRSACNCDSHAVYTRPLMAGTTWPYTKGLAASTFTRATFYPLAGSSVIDAGDPDLDGDGVLENGPGGDDECTVAHHCYGAGPDIGPFEYGIDVPDGGGVAPPTAPARVRRTDVRL